MTNTEFENVFEMEEAESGYPIFKHPEYGILIAGDGEFAGEKEFCSECRKMVDEFGQNQDCECQDDIRFVGLWHPIDWKAHEPATYAIRDENTTQEMENHNGWSIIDVKELEFTGKFRRN